MVLPNNAVTKSSKTWVLALTSIASFITALDTLVVTTALGTIRHDLGASLEALQWTANAYNLCFAVLMLTGAALGDRFGRRRMFVAGMVLFVAASAACALAPSIGLLIAARALQGAGAALLVPLAMAILSVTFPAEERGKALGLFAGITGLALILGPVVGGALAQGISWHWTFWINVPVGLIAIPLIVARIEESRGAAAPIDIGGLLMASGAAFLLVWGLMRGNSAGWASREVVSALVLAAVLIVLFVRYERRAAAPMIPMRLFHAHAFSCGVAASFSFYAAMYGVLFFVAQFFQTAQGFGAFDAGLRMLPWTATLVVIAPVAGRLVNRLGERLLVSGGVLLQAIGMAGFALTAGTTAPYAPLAAAMVTAGTGVVLAMPAAQNAVLSAVAPTEAGKASGVFNMFRFLGGAFGIAIMSAAFVRAGGVGSPDAFASGFTTVLGIAVALSLTGAVIGLGLPGPRKFAAAPRVAGA
jgi:EmrB/QacA subfamily drug resistance transporter